MDQRSLVFVETQMVWYVAIIAVLNLGLGYALALYMERSRRLAVATSDEMLDDEMT